MKQKHVSVGCIVILIIIAVIIGLAYWPKYQQRRFQSWIKEQDKPVVERLNKGYDLFKIGKLGEAAVEYSAAYTLAKSANTAAAKLWKDHIEQTPTPRKFYTGNSNLRWEAGLSYFKNRMIEACYGLASSIHKRIMDKYASAIRAAANDPKKHFTPPAAELKPALDAIEQGLKENIQSEKLRLLRGQIYLETGQIKKAEKELNDLLLISPELANAYNLLGLLYSSPNYMNSSEYELYRQKAVSMFEKAALFNDIDGNPMPEPNYNLGMFYATPPANLPVNAPPPKTDALKALKYLRRYLELAGKTVDNPEDIPNSNQVKLKIKQLEKFEK